MLRVVGNGVSKVCFEGYSMERGKGGVEEGTRATQVRND